MTPVINPWIFYLMPFCDNLCFFSTVVGVVSFLGYAGVIIGHIVTANDGYSDEDNLKQFVAIEKLLKPVVIVSLLLAFLVPSEKTITKMLIAQNVTYERVEVATNTVQSVYEDIMDLFEEEDDG